MKIGERHEVNTTDTIEFEYVGYGVRLKIWIEDQDFSRHIGKKGVAGLIEFLQRSQEEDKKHD